MFLHIGENKTVKTKDILGVFDINSLKKSEENNEHIKNCDDNKTVIITDTKNYYTKISAATISKRII